MFFSFKEKEKTVLFEKAKLWYSGKNGKKYDTTF